jgi:hypothetical protein
MSVNLVVMFNLIAITIFFILKIYPEKPKNRVGEF